jgi:hypothetical protein
MTSGALQLFADSGKWLCDGDMIEIKALRPEVCCGMHVSSAFERLEIWEIQDDDENVKAT